jgi:medium-chain acyl-[acyl-carrier-protein] hydrolase
MRLFCFPFAGGAAASYFDWRRRSADGVEVDPIEYPGRGRRWSETPAETIGALAEAMADELLARTDQPYAVLGHSFGALVGFEVVSRLRRAGAPGPAYLFVSAARAPHLPQDETIHHLPDGEFLGRVAEFGGMPAEVLENPELLAVALPIVRHDFRLFERYEQRGGPPLDVPICALGGRQDHKVPAPDLLGWSRHTSKSFRVRFYPGGHFFLFDPEGRARADVYADLAIPVGSPHGPR